MGRPIVVEIAEAVAHAKGVEPTELGYTLEDHVATDALVNLASHETSRWTLSFELPDHDVTVTNDGTVLVDGTRESRVDFGPYRTAGNDRR